jgi:hypothetical protein
VDLTDEKVNFRGKAPGERNRPIRLAGSLLGPPRHICAFFNNRNDEYRVLLPFIKDGLECGEKAVHTVYPGRSDDHLQRLKVPGIEVDATREHRQLELRSWTETVGRYFDLMENSARSVTHELDKYKFNEVG